MGLRAVRCGAVRRGTREGRSDLAPRLQPGRTGDALRGSGGGGSQGEVAAAAAAAPVAVFLLASRRSAGQVGPRSGEAAGREGSTARRAPQPHWRAGRTTPGPRSAALATPRHGHAPEPAERSSPLPHIARSPSPLSPLPAGAERALPSSPTRPPGSSARPLSLEIPPRRRPSHELGPHATKPALAAPPTPQPRPGATHSFPRARRGRLVLALPAAPSGAPVPEDRVVMGRLAVWLSPREWLLDPSGSPFSDGCCTLRPPGYPLPPAPKAHHGGIPDRRRWRGAGADTPRGPTPLRASPAKAPLCQVCGGRAPPRRSAR